VSGQEQRRIRVTRPGEGESVQVVGDSYRFLAAGGETAGSYFIVEATVPPGGGPPPHYHTREEEGFYVLEGEVEFTADGEVVRAGPGTFLNLPRESRHHFRNVGERPARMLILCAPAGVEAFFRAADGKGPEDVVRLADEAGIKVLV
jgi:quercetin dioxygenase-like cupin family protein